VRPAAKTVLLASLAAAATAIAAAGPAHAQGAGRAAAARGADTAAAAAAVVPAAPSKKSRFGKLAGAAASRVNKAVTKAEQTTGVSRETMAKAALTASGAGAVTMLATPGGASGKLRVATALGREVLAQRAGTRAGQAIAERTMGTGANRAGLRVPLPGEARSGAASGASFGAPSSKLEAEYQALAERAMSGDRAAVEQFARLQQELMHGTMALQSVAPEKQEAALDAMMRDALACAKTGRGCRAK
jgi:hypothetical protein